MWIGCHGIQMMILLSPFMFKQEFDSIRVRIAILCTKLFILTFPYLQTYTDNIDIFE